MAQKLLTHPFVVFKKKDEAFDNYPNFNGKYIIASQIDFGWVYIDIQTYIDNSSQSILGLISDMRSRTYSDTFVYGVNYMVSDGILEEQEISFDNEDTSSDYDNISLYDAIEESALPSLVVGGMFNEEDFDYEKTSNANRINLEIYNIYNKKDYGQFSEEQLKVVCATFCQYILDNTLLEGTLSVQNQIYKNVLQFYANEGTDDVLEKFNLMGSLYTPTNNGGCGCTSISSCTNQAINTQGTTEYCDCSNIYINYITKTLMSMLGDKQFYKDWFVGNSEGDNTNTINEILCDDLIRLLELFMDLGYDLSFTNSNPNVCASVMSEQSECNYQTIRNYIKVLELVRDNNIDYNTNKIKSYGQAFGELLPKLMF